MLEEKQMIELQPHTDIPAFISERNGLAHALPTLDELPGPKRTALTRSDRIQRMNR